VFSRAEIEGYRRRGWGVAEQIAAAAMAELDPDERARAASAQVEVLAASALAMGIFTRDPDDLETHARVARLLRAASARLPR
jgi:hypothetical protein